MVKVMILKNDGCEGFSIGDKCEAIAVQNDGEDGFKVFHHSGWWWLPKSYCEVVQ